MTTRTTDIPATIHHFHAVFCSATGQELRLGICDAYRERAWYDLVQAGFTEQDVLLVVNYLKREIREQRRNPGALKFSNAIAQLDRFEEDLALAKAAQRNARPAPTPKQRALESLRPTVAQLRPEQATNTAKPVSDYIAALRRAAQ